MAVWRKCRLYSTAEILGALFRVRERLTSLLAVFDPLQIPDLEAVDVLLQSSTTIPQTAFWSFARMAPQASQGWPLPAPSRTSATGPRGGRPSSNRSLMSLRISGSMRDV